MLVGIVMTSLVIIPNKYSCSFLCCLRNRYRCDHSPTIVKLKPHSRCVHWVRPYAAKVTLALREWSLHQLLGLFWMRFLVTSHVCRHKLSRSLWGYHGHIEVNQWYPPDKVWRIVLLDKKWSWGLNRHCYLLHIGWSKCEIFDLHPFIRRKYINRDKAVVAALKFDACVGWAELHGWYRHHRSSPDIAQVIVISIPLDIW